MFRRRTADRQGHAIVMGASVAGLLAARVLAEHFETVTVLERDALPNEPDHRKGLPQAHHQHVLLSRGRALIERWFPGFDASLKQAGGPLADYTRDFVLVSHGRRLPRFPSGIELRLCRRMHIDHALLTLLAGEPRVRVRDRSAVKGLLWSADRSRVLGVELASAERLHAELVVDATGRGSRVSRWLSDAGYEAPREQVVDAHLGYATRLFERAEHDAADFRAVEVAAVPPHNPRAAGLWEIEGGRWLLTLIGTAGQHPPTDHEGYMAFAAQLADPLVYETIRRARPLTDAVPFTGTANRFRRYERLKRFPSALLVVGDARCAFNPLYGQGMTIAALEADALHRALRKSRSRGELDHLALRRHFERSIAPVLATAWLLATSEDLRWQETEGERNPLSSLALAYFEQLVALSPESPALIETFLRITNFERSPLALARPRILVDLATAYVRRRQPRAPGPSTKPLAA